ncbi:MAG: hypothetical protein ACRD96_03495 [Bryobacteraceae bacterium]
MHRRAFLQTTTGLAAVAGAAELRLEAIAAPSMPRRLRLALPESPSPAAAVFEVCVFDGWGAPVEELRRAGIEAIRLDETTLVLPFASLEARQSAWSAFTAQGGVARVSGISLWRRL